MIKNFIVLGVLMFSLVGVCGEVDTEWWQTYTIRKDIGDLTIKDSKLILEYVNKQDRDVENTFQVEKTIGFETPLKGIKNGTISFNYRRLDLDNDVTENRYFTDISKKFELNKNEFKLRLRGEIRDKSNESDLIYRLRPLLEISREISKINNQPLKIFTYDELFYDFKEDKLNRDRLAVGLKYKINKNLEISGGIMSEWNLKDSKWDRDNIMFSKLLLEF